MTLHIRNSEAIESEDLRCIDDSLYDSLSSNVSFDVEMSYFGDFGLDLDIESNSLIDFVDESALEDEQNTYIDNTELF